MLNVLQKALLCVYKEIVEETTPPPFNRWFDIDLLNIYVVFYVRVCL